MIPEKNRIVLQYYTSFFFLLVVVLAVLLVVFFPRLSSIYIPVVRQQSWATLDNEIRTTKTVDPQNYWQFREFYNLGNFTFNPQGFSPSITNAFLSEVKAPLTSSSLARSFLIYTSPKIRSLDSLVKASSLSTLIDPNSINLRLGFKSHNVMLLKSTEKTLLIFLLPISEMKKANGYFDYTDPKIESMLKGMYWLNVTEIQNN